MTAVATTTATTTAIALDMPPVTFQSDRLQVLFDRFDLASYRRFLQIKALPESLVTFDPQTESYTVTAPARFAAMLGVERPATREEHPILPALFDDQRELVLLALEAKRFALWCQCGWGKTIAGLEWARQVQLRTGGRVLITTVNEIVSEWTREAERFYTGSLQLPLLRLRSRSAMREWMANGEPGIAITNYEKWNPDNRADQVVNEARFLAGAVLDENRLKTGGGVQKWALGKSMKGIEYKLTLTATPAPNDTMEFASQAMWLEKMRTESDIIWTYFTRDAKTHRWTVKPHARAAFFEFMSTWSVYVNEPKRYGWRAEMPDVPAPDYRVIEVPATAEQIDMARVVTADSRTGQMSLIPCDESNAIQRLKLAQLAKGFRYITRGKTRSAERVKSNKPTIVAGIVREEVEGGAQVLVWTVFEEESEILAALLANVPFVERLTGSTKPNDRLAILDRYRSGQTRVLITRAKVLGYGMNLQMCSAMVFSGFSDSFEDLYQAVRRAVRFGQTERVRVYFPFVPELEGDTLRNIQRKEAEFERSIRDMEANYIRARAKLAGKDVA